MEIKSVSNMPVPVAEYTVGFFTAQIAQLPQGEVMKLEMHLPKAEPEEQEKDAAFGKHLREAIAIVKDWKTKP